MGSIRVMKTLDLTLVVPCFNEEKILQDSITRLLRVLNISKLKYEIIFIDDFSTDSTRSIIMSFCAKHQNLRYLFHKKNMGRGRAVVDGIKISKGRVVGYIDIDLEVSPIYIPHIADIILNKEADAVYGVRIYTMSLKAFLRIVLSKGYSYLVRYYIQIPYKDTETGYKFFNRKKILPLLSFAKNNGWFWDTEITVAAHKRKLRIFELPVLYMRRNDKHSSVRIVNDVFNYLVNLRKLRKRLGKRKLQ